MEYACVTVVHCHQRKVFNYRVCSMHNISLTYLEAMLIVSTGGNSAALITQEVDMQTPPVLCVLSSPSILSVLQGISLEKKFLGLYHFQITFMY